jgi:hypothetical protein
MKPINHIPLLSSLSFTFFPPTSTPPHTHFAYFIVLPFSIRIYVSVQRGFLMYPCCEYTLLWSSQPLPLLSLTLLLANPHFQQVSIHILIFSTYTDVIFYDIVDPLSFSFPFLPFSGSIE